MSDGNVIRPTLYSTIIVVMQPRGVSPYCGGIS
jgi:hypothetical protein